MYYNFKIFKLFYKSLKFQNKNNQIGKVKGTTLKFVQKFFKAFVIAISTSVVQAIDESKSIQKI